MTKTIAASFIQAQGKVQKSSLPNPRDKIYLSFLSWLMQATQSSNLFFSQWISLGVVVGNKPFYCLTWFLYQVSALGVTAVKKQS